MKKRILSIIVCSILLIALVGCNKNEKKEITKEELNELQEEITTNISKQDNYSNIAACYIEDKMVVVELVDNSEEEQNWFKKNIKNSKYIKFIKGGPYTNSISGIDFYISKPEAHNDIKFNDYYKVNDRVIFLAGNIEEFYIINEYKKETLKSYLSNTFQTLDDGIKNITDKLNKIDTFKDGGTSVYKSEEKDLTIILCKTLDRNKDIFIGDYLMEYDENMCK